jgi:hypothetical protein
MNPKQFAAKIRAAHPGSYDDVPDEVLTQRVLAKYPQYKDMVKADAAPTQEPGFPQRMGKGLQDITEGAGAGVLNTVHGTGELIRGGGNLIHQGLGDAIVPPAGQKALREMTYTNSPMQKIGYTGEQIGEFMLPGGATEKAGLKAAELLPKVAKYAKPIAEIGTEAGVSGLQNKMQGGDFSTGAAFGAGGNVIGKGLQSAAPRIAEAAAEPGKRLLKTVAPGVDIGKTILTESKGYKPSTIAGELGEKVAEHSNAVSDAAELAKKNGSRVSLGPARQIAGDEAAEAVAKNSPAYLKDVTQVNRQLTRQTLPGNGSIPLPSSVDPVKARALKQGIDLEIGSWNPEAQSAIDPLKERVYGALNAEFHKAVPEAAAHDAAMTSLIPSQKAISNVAFNPGITRSVFNRIARPTGALVGAGLGASEGYKEGGVPGAIAGGVGGLVIPHLVTSPTGMMVAARAADKGLPPVMTKPILPLLRQKKSKEEEEQDQR